MAPPRDRSLSGGLSSGPRKGGFHDNPLAYGELIRADHRIGGRHGSASGFRVDCRETPPPILTFNAGS
jgi:hypothetical protein